MKKNINYFYGSKKAFTIVELVIVIAVIAVLAAVLIPTFANMVKKANLSADKQAVREMNQALANFEAANAGAKPKDIETVMQVLANAGYNTLNWQCLTAGYQVFWDSTDDKMVLYNTKTAEMEYPEEYSGKDMVALGAADRFKLYNQNVKTALSQDISFSSGGANTTTVDLSSGGTKTGTEAVLANALVGDNANNELKNALGMADSTAAFINAKKTLTTAVSSGTYASMDVMLVSGEEELKSSDKLNPNLYVINVAVAEDATPEQKLEAEKAAGEFVYTIFVQANTGVIKNDVSVVIPAGTTINVSEHEWQAVKSWTGYFGTTDDEHPIIIDGMKLSEATGYALTYPLQGSASKYFMTGFIGVVYGKATVENLTFRNVTIKSPGADFTVASGSNSRNTVGIIGGIIPDPTNREAAVDVTIRNIKVESTCNIIGEASVGGIVGYIGAENDYTELHGTVTITGCEFAGTLESKDSVYVAGNYSPVGGILGFTCRAGKVGDTDCTINITNCKFTGKIKSFGYAGGIVGNLRNSIVVKATAPNVCNITGCTATGTFEKAGLCTNPKTEYIGKDYAKYGSLVGDLGCDVTSSGNTLTEGVALTGNGADAKVK